MMKYKQRILRGPQRPSLFRSPLFYVFITALLSFIAFHQFAGRNILHELSRKNLSLQLRREGEALNHLLFHQFFIFGMKKDDVKLTLKKAEKDRVSWSVYQIEITLHQDLPVQPVSESFKNQIRFSLPALSLQSRLLENGKYQLTIQQDEFTLAELTFVPASASKPPQIETKPAITGRIAIVIDDLGPNLKIARELLALNYPLTFSILPFYTHSKEIAAEAHSQGREVMVHLPLEPRDNQNLKPEKGTLYTWMDDDKILAQLREDLSAIPYVSGVNGHMGSRFTEDKRSMGVLFRELKILDLYFLDSLTTNKSAGSTVAQNVGIRYGKRGVFIDRDLEDNTVEERLLQLGELSKKRGYAIGIAHPSHDTINTLKKMLPLLSSEGIEVVSLSQIINHSAQKP
jgi:hypothetical protein